MLTDKYHDFSDQLRQQFSIRALNDTAGPKGVVHSLPVFGTIPSICNTGSNLLDQEHRFEATRAAWNEAAGIVAEQRIRM